MGYDNDKDFSPSLNLMGHRMGLNNRVKPTNIIPDKQKKQEYMGIGGLQSMEDILDYNGGNAQQDRMILDKRRSLDRALKYSYQGAFIKKVDGESAPWNIPKGFEQVYQTDDGRTRVRALINPNKLKPDYDDKILSVPFEHGFKAGDVFEWENTNTKWLITSQNKTELAYFRGDIRRCNYLLKWIGADKEIHECYAATRGPVETKINFIQKQGISVDTPNHTLNILMPKRKDVLEYFQRYSKFYLQSSLFAEDPENQEEIYKICFRVEAVDWVSTPGIFELTASEYYSNKDEDDIDGGLVGGLIKKEKEMGQSSHCIKGPKFIKPMQEIEYKYVGILKSSFKIDSKYPVELKIDKDDPSKCTVKWTAANSGQFEIECSGRKHTIVVESLF